MSRSIILPNRQRVCPIAHSFAKVAVLDLGSMRRRAGEGSNECGQGNHYATQVDVHYIFQRDFFVLSNKF
jgi:hypothetical protein